MLGELEGIHLPQRTCNSELSKPWIDALGMKDMIAGQSPDVVAVYEVFRADRAGL